MGNLSFFGVNEIGPSPKRRDCHWWLTKHGPAPTPPVQIFRFSSTPSPQLLVSTMGTAASCSVSALKVPVLPQPSQKLDKGNKLARLKCSISLPPSLPISITEYYVVESKTPLDRLLLTKHEAILAQKAFTFARQTDRTENWKVHSLFCKLDFEF